MTAPVQVTLDRCPWCGEERTSEATVIAGTRRCEACGVDTTDPWPSDGELDAAYATWYRPAGGRFSGAGDKLLRFSRGRLARRLNRISPPGAILDVGAGDGSLLDALARTGRDAVGLERPGLAEADAAHPAIRFAQLDDIDGAFAAVALWHSLEHLRAPGAALARAQQLLAPDGVLVVSVPNAASLQARAFGDRWFALDLPRHLVHIPAAALIDKLAELGLHVERVSYVRGGQVIFGWLHGLVGVLPGHPDLYDAIRRPAARRTPITRSQRLATLAAATVLYPLALAAAAIEVTARRGGTVYVEARRT